MDTTNLNDAIMHYGVKGMKWDKEKKKQKEEERLKKEREQLAKVIVDQANGVKTTKTVTVSGVNVKPKPKTNSKQSVKVNPKDAKALTDKINSDRKKEMSPARKKLDNVVNKITDKLSKKSSTKKSSVPSVVVAKPKAKTTAKPTIQKYDRNPVPGIQKSITKVTKSNPKPTKKKKTNTKSNVYVNYVRAR